MYCKNISQALARLWLVSQSGKLAMLMPIYGLITVGFSAGRHPNTKQEVVIFDLMGLTYIGISLDLQVSDFTTPRIGNFPIENGHPCHSFGSFCEMPNFCDF